MIARRLDLLELLGLVLVLAWALTQFPSVRLAILGVALLLLAALLRHPKG